MAFGLQQCLNTARPAGQAARCCLPACQPAADRSVLFCSVLFSESQSSDNGRQQDKTRQSEQKDVRRKEKLKEHRNKRGLKRNCGDRKQERHCTRSVTLRSVRVTIAAV
jgi:hypothetical protein